jgi:hypothetical protein
MTRIRFSQVARFRIMPGCFQAGNCPGTGEDGPHVVGSRPV